MQDKFLKHLKKDIKNLDGKSGTKHKKRASKNLHKRKIHRVKHHEKAIDIRIVGKRKAITHTHREEVKRHEQKPAHKIQHNKIHHVNQNHPRKQEHHTENKIKHRKAITHT